MLKGLTDKLEPLKILTDEQVEAIHRGTLDVLEEAGVRFEHERALKLFADNGCHVDFGERLVRIPNGLVEDCLRKCPSSFAVKARDTNKNLRMALNTLYLCNSVGARIVNLDTWESRPATIKEQHDGVIVLDALDTCHIIGPYTPYMDIEGIPPAMVQLETNAGTIEYSSKASFTGYSNDSEVFSIMMAKAAGMDLIGMVLASPPLTYFKDSIEAAFRFVEAGFPVYLATGDVYGGTAPATIAGSTISNNAEIIAGLVMVQLIRPGTPVLPGDFTFSMDMRGGHPVFCGVESSLHQVAFAQIWRSYEIPSVAGAPGFPMSKKIDFQSGYEKSLAILTAALSGANLIEWHGCVTSALTWSPVQAVLDDDIAGWIRRFLEGVKVNDETLAIDLIKEVGPIPGYYLNKQHTRQWWRKEQFIPRVADREAYQEWLDKGRKDTIARAQERVDEILSAHKPTPLTSSQKEEIERILKEAREHYKKKGLISDAEWKVYMKTLESPNYWHE